MEQWATPGLSNRVARLEPLSLAHAGRPRASSVSRSALADLVHPYPVSRSDARHHRKPPRTPTRRPHGSLGCHRRADRSSGRDDDLLQPRPRQPATRNRLHVARQGGTADRLNTATKLLLLTRAFEELGCLAVEFRAHWHNHQSRRAIEGLGAKQDGVLRKHTVFENGTIRDTVVYSITDDEWPTVKFALHERLAASASR